MGVDIDLTQVRALGSRLSTAGARVGAKASAALRKTVFDIEADAKQLAPYETGNLKSSISSTITGDGRFGSMTAEVGPTAEYGIYQEFGTSVMAANPFMGPAFDRRVPGYTAALAQIADEAI